MSARVRPSRGRTAAHHGAERLAGGAFAALITALRAGDEGAMAIAVAHALAHGESGGEETVRAIDAALRVATDAGPLPPSPESLVSLGEGWIAEEALAIALCCALAHPDGFTAATRLAANQVRGDSDSIASMTGQVVGLLVGLDGLPADWLADLALGALIEKVADALAAGA